MDWSGRERITELSQFKYVRRCFKRKAFKSGKTIFECKKVFKLKNINDGTKKYKAKSVLKKYMQVLGIDYLERYLLVSSNITTRIVINITLMKFKDKWLCIIINIATVSFEGRINKNSLLRMDLPPMINFLGYITKTFMQTHCIRQKKSIYGNIDAAI